MQETHYVSYDPDEIWKKMQEAYISAGGDLLYPGDEKEMLLRGVQNIVVHALGTVDTALKMATLKYAQGDFLDLYGQKRNCIRIQAQSAVVRVKITFQESGKEQTIIKGTALTVDGQMMYLMTEDILQTGLVQEVETELICQTAGSAGNALTKGTLMQFINKNPAVKQVITLTDAAGGNDRETDEDYRERIRTYGLTSTTTGPEMQYESVAKKVSGQIIDAAALNLGAGQVGVYLLLKSQEGAAGIIESVKNALSAKDVRPLTDTVTVEQAKEKTYKLTTQYQLTAGSNKNSLLAAVAEYKKWQDEKIGRAFNPDKLVAMLYQAGAARIVFQAGSSFDSGEVKYTEVPPDTHCKGDIELVVLA